MKTFALTTALALGLAAPVFANDQLALNLGVEPGVFTTAELAQIKATTDYADDNRISEALKARTGGAVSTQSFGISAGHAQLAAELGVNAADFSVSELVAIRALVDNDSDNVARSAAIAQVQDGVVSTQSVGISAGHEQLAALIGVDPADYSFAELVAIKGSYTPEDGYRF